MIATTQPENGAMHRDAIALPLLRPVAKPASIPHRTPGYPTAVETPVAPPAPPAPSSPPTVQSIPKLNLDLLMNGDKVVVRTANSTYNFEIADHHCCRVVPSKSTSRSGDAILMGGTNADATEYTPNRVFVGGRLAYQFPDEESAILTSLVDSIFLVSARKPVQV